MSVFETPRTTSAHDEALKIRLELKEWERLFAATHDGRKASRGDIKQHPDIAHKYKQYNNLRAAISNPQHSPKPAKRISSPAQPAPLEVRSPKRQKISQPVHPATLGPYDSPRSVHRTPKHYRTCIGPTPQKDGRVLGLFDLLSPASNSQKTPSKRRSLGAAELNAFATPSKHKSVDEDEAATFTLNSKRPSKSPLSGSKRTHPDSFLTPSAQRVNKSTPTSKQGITKLLFDDTPNFLRRDSQNAWTKRQSNEGCNSQGEEANSWSPVAIRRRPTLAGRGLSALVKGLRDMEDEKLDEEMDILREMEADDQDQNICSVAMPKAPTIVVEDSQVFDMPLGPDGARASEDDEGSDEKETRGRDGKPLKVWKKKGQKRTTRKANIKPSAAKWKPEPEWKAAEKDDAADELSLVAETQLADPELRAVEVDAGSDDMQYMEATSGSESEEPTALKPRPKVKDREAQAKPEPGPKQKKKVSATAHANFRALKIKNKQSKGKRGSRFGRGRR